MVGRIMVPLRCLHANPRNSEYVMEHGKGELRLKMELRLLIN